MTRPLKMEELLVLLAEITIDDIFPVGSFVVSEGILADLALTTEAASEVYSDIIRSYALFQAWCAATLPSVENILNAAMALQLLYNMLSEHYRLASRQNRAVDVETAMQDIEATLVANYAVIAELAKNKISSPDFASLPEDVQAVLTSTANSTPREYWILARIPIMRALLKIPMYST